MKLAFITGDHVYRAMAIAPVLAAHAGSGGHRCQFIIEDFLLPNKSLFGALAHIHRKAGTAYFFYKVAESTSTALAGLLSRFGLCKARIPTLGGLARTYGVQTLLTKDVNAEKTIEAVREFAPDYIISMGMQRLKSALIDVPKHGVINLHLGLLPDYRGLGCYIFPLLDGARETGATVHYVTDEEFDTGDILASGVYPIGESDSIARLHLQNTVLGGHVLVRALDGLEAGEIEARPQEGGRYYSFPTRAEIVQLKAKGVRLIRLRDFLDLIGGQTALPAEARIEPNAGA